MTNDLGKPLPRILAAVVFLWPGWLGGQESAPAVEPPPIKALLITGGASHDYGTRKEILVQGIRERVKRRIEWVVRHEGDGESDVQIPVFQGGGWADGYDIVVHDYCFPRVTDRAYVDRILAPHRAGLPAVLVHGTMHSFRTGDDAWFEFCGATSRRHGRPQDFSVEAAPGGNPIIAGMTSWTVPRGELYLIERLHADSTPLTFSRFTNGEGEDQATTWSHLYGPAKARVFASTLGNEPPTLLTPAFLDLLAKGFLWALDDLQEENFTLIPAEESLASLKLEEPEVPLPRPGPSLATGGRTTAMTTSPSPLLGAEMAIDGDPITYWEADGPGPSSWQLDMRREREVGAVTVIWKDEAPQRYEVEGSRDGLSWRALLETSGQGMMPVSIGFDPRPLRFLRVSVSATEPGFVPGIREIAAYGHMDDLPAAFPDFVSINGAPRVVLQTVGAGEQDNSIRLAPGWTVGGRGNLPAGEEIIQIVPTASGEVFVLTRHAVEKVHKVYLGTPVNESEISFRIYLNRLPGSPLIAYDGEWVYTLAGADLNAYRDTDGDKVADERARSREILSMSGEKPTAGIKYTDFRAGPDGWLYAIAETSGNVAGFNSLHERVELPGHGLMRFRTTGNNLRVHASSNTSLDDFQFGKGGRILVRTSSFETGNPPQIRFLPPLPGHAWQELPPLAWPPSIAEDPRWDNLEATHLRNSLYIREGGFNFPQIAEIHGLDQIAEEGGRVWFSRQDKSGASVAILIRAAEEPVPPVIWDSIPAKELITHLSSSRRAVRTEAVFEILRRKYYPNRDLGKILEGDGSADTFTGVLATISAKGGEEAHRELAKVAQGPDSLKQALAFQQLADHPYFKNHPVFGEVSHTTVPSVTAAILAAMEGTGTTIDGLEALALSLASHPDVTLAATARAFLQERGVTAVCFNVLDDETAESAWPAAFDVLSGIRRLTVVEGIVLRLEQTRSARLRALGLETLLGLYYDDGINRREWAGTPLIDMFLRASLLDHRVDRAALLRGMIGAGVPPPSPDTLAALGSADISLESFAVRSLSSDTVAAGFSFPEYAVPWLEQLVESPERDLDLRIRALGLLAAHGEDSNYRGVFDEIVKFYGSPPVGDAIIALMRHWHSRKDHLLQIPWLREQSVGGQANRAALAWTTILFLLGKDDTPAAEREVLLSHLIAISGNRNSTATALAPLVAALPYAADTEAALIIAAAERHADESIGTLVRDGILERSAQASNGSARVTAGEIDTGTLAELITPIEGDPVLGRHLFKQLSCNACHNIHGEGPSIGPDLSASFKSSPLIELIDSVLVRGGGLAPRENAAVYELATGRRLAGFEAIEETDHLRLRDRLGNAYSLDPDVVRIKFPLTGRAMICDTAGLLSVAEFASLVDYLKTLTR